MVNKNRPSFCYLQINLHVKLKKTHTHTHKIQSCHLLFLHVMYKKRSQKCKQHNTHHVIVMWQ